MLDSLDRSQRDKTHYNLTHTRVTTKPTGRQKSVRVYQNTVCTRVVIWSHSVSNHEFKNFWRSLENGIYTSQCCLPSDCPAINKKVVSPCVFICVPVVLWHKNNISGWISTSGRTVINLSPWLSHSLRCYTQTLKTHFTYQNRVRPASFCLWIQQDLSDPIHRSWQYRCCLENHGLSWDPPVYCLLAPGYDVISENSGHSMTPAYTHLCGLLLHWDIFTFYRLLPWDPTTSLTRVLTLRSWITPLKVSIKGGRFRSKISGLIWTEVCSQTRVSAEGYL